MQDSSESAGGDLFETWEDCSRESYGSQLVKFRVDSRGRDDNDCFRIKVMNE